MPKSVLKSPNIFYTNLNVLNCCYEHCVCLKQWKGNEKGDREKRRRKKGGKEERRRKGRKMKEKKRGIN